MFKILVDETLKAAIEEDSSLACDQLAERFQVSDETIKLHMHSIVKTFKLSKWYLTHFWTSKSNNEYQPVSRCFIDTATHSYSIECSPVTKSGGSCMVLYTGCQLRTLWLSPQGYPYNCDRSCSVFEGLVDKWCTMSCYQRIKQSLHMWTHSSWNVCNK